MTRTESQTSRRPKAQPQPDSGPPIKRQFVTFTSYQIDPAWRRLDSDHRSVHKQQFAAVVDRSKESGQIICLNYSLVGLRGDAEFMLWRICESLEPLQKMSSELLGSGLGGYLRPVHSFISQTKRSTYIDKIDPEHGETRTRIVPGQKKYIFVYPFVKKREWYLLSKHTRQGIMDEHIAIGTKYPSVKLNTTYSFGLDDQEFVVAFESDVPGDFLDLVQELRESDGSAYTERDTPILTGIRMPIMDVLDSLGG